MVSVFHLDAFPVAKLWAENPFTGWKGSRMGCEHVLDTLRRKPDRKCTYNVTCRRVSATIVEVEKQ
jgi:hypothetical protein